jgi:hypothetical protein
MTDFDAFWLLRVFVSEFGIGKSIFFIIIVLLCYLKERKSRQEKSGQEIMVIAVIFTDEN